MSAAQSLLFPDARPLVERLGPDFFRQLPDRPGVYLMRDDQEQIVYVGKAKSLRKRLGSYRVANPDRLPKRLLRLLHTVARIEHRECTDEAAALATEAVLLRELKPRFNRAGVWSAPPRSLAWKREGEGITFKLSPEPMEGWTCHGPLPGGAAWMLVSLIRIFWALTCVQRGLVGMPAGWFHGRMPEEVHLPADGETIETWMHGLLAQPPSAVATLGALVLERHRGWQLEVLTEDLELIERYFQKLKSSRP